MSGLARGVLLLAAGCTGVGPGETETCDGPCGPAVPTAPGTATATATTTGSAVSDRIVQGTPLADVLFVVDNSCSMSDDQAALADAFPYYIDYFPGTTIDYHIGVVSTDLDVPGRPGSEGELVEVAGDRWIHPGTPDPVAAFAAMSQLGSVGSGNERGLGAAYLALEIKADTTNAGFLREGSGLHLIVLSDEPDSTQQALVTQQEFVAWLLELADGRPATSFTSIVRQNGLEAGTEYIATTQAVGGSVYDIDNVDYTIAMDLLGMETSNLNRTFCPSQPVDPATLAVSVELTDGTIVAFTPADYELTAEGCVRFLAYAPQPGSTVVLDYVPAP
jgi:hypothetical protein